MGWKFDEKGRESPVGADVPLEEPTAWGGGQPHGQAHQVGLLGAVEVGQEGELVHDTDQAAVGRRGQPVFEGLDVFGLDQWRRYSMGG
jgi:hypothetical protein